MDTIKLFTNKKSQTVRLPKAYRIKGKEVFVTKVGDAIILIPNLGKWNTLIASLNKFSDDFIFKRIQPKLEKREELF
jgi:antitoxin VapB